MSEKLITLSNLSEFKNQMDQAIAAKGFITKAVNDLTNYYLKSETYTKAEVTALVNTVKQFSYECVSELPATASAETMYKLYFVPATGGSGRNVKVEWITLRTGEEGNYTYTWEKIGDTDIDLSGYSTTEQMTAAIASAVAGFKTEAQIRAIVESYGYATQSAMTTALNGKVDKVSGKGLSTNDYTTADKNKLAGIEAGAQVNVIENICAVSYREDGDGHEEIDKQDYAEISGKTALLILASDSEIDSMFS